MQQPFLPSAPRRCAAQPPVAVGPLYRRYEKRVHGIARALLGSREEAEDLTQEVFLTLCRPTAYDPSRGSVTAFLTILTRSRAIDLLRSRARSARLLKTWHEAAYAETPPCDHAARRRVEERVRAALAGLSAPRRDVLELAYYRGLSQPEIAAELDIPLGTVKSRSRRALLDLEDALRDFDEKRPSRCARVRARRPPNERADGAASQGPDPRLGQAGELGLP